MIYVFINRYVRQISNSVRLSAYKALVKQQSGQPTVKQFKIRAVQNEASPKENYDKVFEEVLKWLRTQKKLNDFTVVITTDDFASPNLKSKYNSEGFTNLHFTTANTDQNATLMTLKKQTAMKVNQFVRKQQQKAKQKHDALVAKHKAVVAKKQREIAHKKHEQAIEHQRQVDIAKLVQKLHDSEEGMTKYFAEHHSVVINLNNLIHHRPISTTTQKQIDKIKLASKPSVSPTEKATLSNKIKEVEAQERALNDEKHHQSIVAQQQASQAKDLQAHQIALQNQASANAQTSFSHSSMGAQSAMSINSNPNRANIGGQNTNPMNMSETNNNSDMSQTNNNSDVQKLRCLLSTIDGLIKQPKHAHISSDDVKHWTNPSDQVYVPFILNYLIEHKYITGSNNDFKVQIGRYHGFFN